MNRLGLAMLSSEWSWLLVWKKLFAKVDHEYGPVVVKRLCVEVAHDLSTEVLNVGMESSTECSRTGSICQPLYPPICSSSICLSVSQAVYVSICVLTAKYTYFL